jgi:predicted outer membrane repeat protein
MRKFTTIIIISLVSVLLGCSEHTVDSDSSDDEVPTNVDRVIRVPSQAATIQQAIDQAEDGDTVLLADGIYTSKENRDLVISSKSIVIKSENGPEKTIIDCQGGDDEFHFGFEIRNRGSNNTVIEGITIRNGYDMHSGAIFFSASSPTLINCVFADNTALTSGGAIKCKGSSPRFINCTFVNNTSPSGASVFLLATSQPIFENCIIAFSRFGEAILCNENSSFANLTCSNLFSNEGGDWIDCLTEQFDSKLTINGNISADPEFCDIESGNYSLLSSSPCKAENNSCNLNIGAVITECR